MQLFEYREKCLFENEGKENALVNLHGLIASYHSEERSNQQLADFLH